MFSLKAQDKKKKKVPLFLGGRGQTHKTNSKHFLQVSDPRMHPGGLCVCLAIAAPTPLPPRNHRYHDQCSGQHGPHRLLLFHAVPH